MCIQILDKNIRNSCVIVCSFELESLFYIFGVVLESIEMPTAWLSILQNFFQSAAKTLSICRKLLGSTLRPLDGTNLLPSTIFSEAIVLSLTSFCYIIQCSYCPADILVPLDNYISRGTDQFIACKDPDYQQSLWRALSSVSELNSCCIKICSEIFCKVPSSCNFYS